MCVCTHKGQNYKLFGVGFLNMMSVLHQDFISFRASNSTPQTYPRSSFPPPQTPSFTVGYTSYIHTRFPMSLSFAGNGTRYLQYCAAAQSDSGRRANSESDPNAKYETKRKGRPRKRKDSQTELSDAAELPPKTTPGKPRRGRKSEVEAVEDFVRNSLEKTFASIQDQNPEVFVNKKQVLKKGNENADSAVSAEDEDKYDDIVDGLTEQEMAVDEDDPNWPLDADVGWGIRASDYFDKHAIKNVVGDDGLEIDWEGEIDDSWVQEINCLEWENFAFHPSPLIVLVFERYIRATDNWKLLKELEKALQVYWNANNRLPPRAVKLDTNIEKDLAYALKVKQSPQILFLLGQRVLYREKELRTSDELVQMIAYFYYKAKKPSWIDDAALSI